MQPALRRLDFGLLRDLQRVVYLDPEVSNGAFQLAMAEQELNGPQVLRASVDQCRLGPPHCVRAINRRIKSDGGNPLMHNTGVLSCRNMGRLGEATRKQALLRFQFCLLDPGGDSGPRRLRQFELHWPLRFSLHNHRTCQNLVAVRDVPNM